VNVLANLKRKIGLFELDSHQLRFITIGKIALLTPISGKGGRQWTHVCVGGYESYCIDVEDDVPRILAKIDALAPVYGSAIRAAMEGTYHLPMPWMTPPDVLPARP